ncbi:MAG TPA: GNAT family N-acetyltransferase [Povalibacter sp.]|uniref:GNAT family N-acetyltransferase n=1 Tax=Povalibacter sp. TaxID=1962978 RepID=UPI002B52E9DC|nr:GNAT family N-acetyltransferase [Povalibacter sp.]HMN45405.1 GNAT family N-acetyltransferase [Povalibacter sp.]
MVTSATSVRVGSVADAEAIAALAIQVFLDTYATEGVRPDLAREAFAEYGHTAFVQRLSQEERIFYLAEQGEGLLGFAEVLRNDTESPVPGIRGSELVRLYVQPQAQGRGLGRALLQRVERGAREAGSAGVWLSAWERNTRALSFYKRQRYEDVGHALYVIQGQSFGNRIFFRSAAGEA